MTADDSHIRTSQLQHVLAAAEGPAAVGLGNPVALVSAGLGATSATPRIETKPSVAAIQKGLVPYFPSSGT